MNQYHDILARGVAEIIVKKDFEQALASGKKLRVKLGIDPTAPDLHLGHTVPLRKLRQFQNAGHQAVLIIGDCTAMIGDPSGRAGAREPLTKQQIADNARHFLNQAGKILAIKTLEVRHNSEWLNKLFLKDILELAGTFTLQQITQREDFNRRLANNVPVGFHETLYPLMQAYDSVMVKADIELGGVDQKLNLLTGRHLMAKRGMTPQHIILVPLIEGTGGVKKMSKSAGNYIGLNDAPNTMFGKLMSVPDELVPKYFELLTDVNVPILQQAHDKRDAKLMLAKTIVEMYHGAEVGKRAEEWFIKTFSKKEVPDDMPALRIMNHELRIIDLLMTAGIKSKSEARRLITQGGVSINSVVKNNPEELVMLASGDILRIGKQRFFKLVKGRSV